MRKSNLFFVLQAAWLGLTAAFGVSPHGHSTGTIRRCQKSTNRRAAESDLTQEPSQKEENQARLIQVEFQRELTAEKALKHVLDNVLQLESTAKLRALCDEEGIKDIRLLIAMTEKQLEGIEFMSSDGIKTKLGTATSNLVIALRRWYGAQEPKSLEMWLALTMGDFFEFMLKNPAPNSTPQSLDEKKMFNLDHLLSVKCDESWVDCGNGLEFTGRSAYVEDIKTKMESMFESKPDGKKARALVYSSVSGSGKTVSMLQLKAKLPCVKGMPVVVAYLGFNVQLNLDEEEILHIMTSGDIGAKHVLARRLVGATIISMNNPHSVAKLPTYELVYEGYEIPSAKKSMEILLQYLKERDHNQIYIIAGVDEVQLLNNAVVIPGSPLGRLFLRILREWQVDLYKDGVRLVPLGTGIAIDWIAEPTTGSNRPLSDEATLISKTDFHALVMKVVYDLSDEEFKKRLSSDTSKETAIALIAAAFWPRVRLLEWWRDNETDLLRDRFPDSNSEQWVNWLCRWMREEKFSCVDDSSAVPGKDDPAGGINSLFELSTNAQTFSVIPDGYQSLSLIGKLSSEFEVPRLFNALTVIKSMEPKNFILKDGPAFEDLGFHTVGAAIHVGLYALSSAYSDEHITGSSATEIQKKRLGLALWFQDNEAVTHRSGTLCSPDILGHVESTDAFVGDFFPFESRGQESFMESVVNALGVAVRECRPLYIRCGRCTCCDYLYFYVRMGENSLPKLLCNVVDAKYTIQDVGSNGDSVTTADQEKLYKAVSKVESAVKAANQVLGDVRLLFVSNREKLSNPNESSEVLLEAEPGAKRSFPDLQLELLNVDTFDFGPFSDILWARRRLGVGSSGDS